MLRWFLRFRESYAFLNFNDGWIERTFLVKYDTYLKSFYVCEGVFLLNDPKSIKRIQLSLSDSDAGKMRKNALIGMPFRWYLPAPLAEIASD